MGEYGQIVQRCIQREYVIVCGAEDHYKRAGNLLMFMAHAVRYVRRYGSCFDLTSVFVFPGKVHTPAHLDAVKRGVERYGGTYYQVSAWSEVAAHLNAKTVTVNGKTCQKRVQVLIFFAHGSPGKIWLSADESLYFTTSDLPGVDAGSFTEWSDYNDRYGYRHVTSWACQTGNAANANTPDEARRLSLAQAVANTWDIEMRASITKTDYSDTWTGWRPWDTNSDRTTIDGGLWEPDGADDSVFSGAGSLQGNMPSGMWQFKPGQTSGYVRLSLD